MAAAATIRKSTRRPGVCDTAKIRHLFDAYDANHDGGISLPELTTMLEKMSIRMPLDEQKRFFGQIDVDNSGLIEFGEFLDWYTTLMDLVEEAALRSLRQLQDTTTFSRAELETIYENYKRVSASVVDDGTIDLAEFRQMMIAGGVASWNSFLVDGLFRLFDADNSGTITFEEFVRILAIHHGRAKASSEDKHRLMFQLYDVDGDGRLSRADLTKILNDCLCSNNMALGEADLAKLIDATFARSGCGDSMSLEQYLKEVKCRQL